MEQLPQAVRDLFPIAKRYIYMNHASVSPLSIRVADNMKRQIEDTMNHGTVVSGDWDRMYEHARRLVARLIGARPKQIAFFRNTSEAISTVANGISWQRGDNIVSCHAEFPANMYPWLRVAAEWDIDVRLADAPDGCLNEDALLAKIDGRTRVVTVSWVHFVSGHRTNLGRIAESCRRRGALFVVDAIQGLGALTLDVEREGVDVVASGANKFLLGPEGVSLLFLSERALSQVRPTTVGWTSVRNYRDYLDYQLEYRDGALCFEPGTMNTVGIYGLTAAIELFLEIGPSTVQRYLLDLRRHLSDQLQRAGLEVAGSCLDERLSAIVSCRRPRYSPNSLAEKLARQHIIVSDRLGWLRLSPHFYNTIEEADQVIDILTA